MANNRDVARAFAQDRSQPATGSNLYHDGRVIYSYGSHWPIAVKLDDNRVLANRSKYSASTSKHTTYALGALAQAGWQIINSTVSEAKQAARDPSYRPALEACAAV